MMRRRPRRAEQGVALITVMLAIFIMTVVVAALAIATMGESTLSFDQLRGQQALTVAEAGAYRALAELRRRVSVDLEARVSAASSVDPAGTENAIRSICRGAGIPARRRVEILVRYAFPTSRLSSDWALSGPAGETAILTFGSSGSRIRMSDSSTGQMLGEFYAILAVRDSGAPPSCLFGTNAPEQEVMWFDYAILSVGRVGNASRAVCLRSGFADRCPDWFPVATASPDGSFVLSGGAYSGWPVMIEKASYSRWALMLLDVGSVWLYTGTTINGPVHSNTEIRIAGNPALNDAVTQVNTDMQLFNCGSPNRIRVPVSNPNATLTNAGCDNTTGSVFGGTVTGGVASVALPGNANPSRTSIGLSPTGSNATDAEIQARTTDPEAAGSHLNNGVYVMDACGAANCGGIYVKGDVQQMVLSSEGGQQVIRVTVDSDPTASRRNMKIIIDPVTKSVTTCWGLVGHDPGSGSCAGWAHSRSYGANTFNGVLYVNGTIESDPDPAASSGLYGVVNRQMRLTIATEGEMRITDHLVYEAPPAGPGHNPLNVLGLYSVTGNVTIHGEVAPDDLYIDAAVLAPAGRFWVDGWNSLPLKGSIYSLGGTVQGQFGAFGGFSPDTGYGRVMTYDWRLRSNVSPPFFPVTDIYTSVRWTPEIAVPPFVHGDALYERPQWEEMVGL
jgi:hypothetical protein